MNRYNIPPSVLKQRSINEAKVMHLPSFEDEGAEPKMVLPPAAPPREIIPKTLAASEQPTAPPRMATARWLTRIQENARQLESARQEQQGEA